tara:strand:- start:3118 stop:3378 length:261 start_codon:yes stop_codon:yes gene_type:complete
MKLKLSLMSVFCLVLASCGGGGGGGGGDDVYGEYHDLVCKAANIDGSYTMTEALKLNQEVAEFAQKKASKMTDPAKIAKALDLSDC